MLGLIAIGIAFVSLILNIVGLAIPYWQHFSVQGIDSNSGLWQFCVDGECADFPDVLVSSELKATRAFVILGMIVLIGALVCAFLKLAVMKEMELLPKVAGGLSELAGVLMIVAVIIYATQLKVDGYDLHAGFALTIVAAIGSFVAGAIFFVDKGQQ